MKKNRVFTEDELKEMSISTKNAAIKAVKAGNKEKALEWINRMGDQAQTLVDSYVSWVADLMDYIYVHNGAEALEEALRKTFEKRMEALSESWLKRDFRGQVQEQLKMLRPLFQDLEIEEDDEKVCINMTTCATGQRLLESGAYDPPKNLSRMKPHRLTAGLSDFPIYCAHAPLMELIAIEKTGRPLAVSRFAPKVATEPCRDLIYKDQKSIPEEAYKRVGMKKPK